ncbi:MAG TPA: xanthine dehydrogenase family protein molybdopterin-binding subunit [Bryobacteraceae bacterium]|nr:xanthine dehydrogenase family protein molybdopterin-binding subunit [Bryobacteraceae bacterium]
MSSITKLNRRAFLQTGIAAAAGLTLRFRLAAQSGRTRVNAYVHVASDDSVTLMITKAEMGQGTATSLAMLLAEELECDWNRVRTEFAPVDAAYGPMQGVFGSMSIRTQWTTMRKAGAAAREMLVEAAARQWGVAASQCHAENGSVVNTATNARLSYGSLAEAASRLSPPSSPALKSPKEFWLVGTPMKRLDTPVKVNGQAQFGLDFRMPGMLYATVARCPVFGGKVAKFDDSAAKAVPGVKHVVQISSGVAVVADNTWNAMEGRRALKVEWNEGPTATMNSDGISKLFAERTLQPGAVARKEGDPAGVLAGGAKKIEAVYEAPFLAHAAMEPLNATAHVRADECDIWASTQVQSWARDAAVKITGLKPDNVRIHTLYLGGGFGRRGGTDYIVEAVEISKALGVPVKLTWSREDDMQHDLYRPASLARFSAAVDADGWPTAWTTRIACPSILQTTSGSAPQGGMDRTSVEGAADLPYAVPNILVDYHLTDVGIPVSFWRAVGYTQNTFFVESFLDEVAAASGKDPVEFRRRLLAKSPRLLAVLEKVAEESGWGKPLAAGRARGVAVVNNVGSYSAQVAEISVKQGKLRVHRVVAAVDCGYNVNPALIEQQLRSGIVYGLAAALKGQITIDRGRVQQENFHQYDVLRIAEMPQVDVHIVRTENAPGGIGESAVPAIAPAVCNAIYAATGKRIRKLPIQLT